MSIRVFSVFLYFILMSVFVLSCGYSSEPTAAGSVQLLFDVRNGSVTSETATSITFDVTCNGGSTVSQTIVLGSSSGITVQKNASCTLDMTSYTRSGVAYTPAATHLITTISSAGAVTTNSITAAAAKRYSNGSANLYFLGGANALATPYSVLFTFSSNLGSLIPLLPSGFSSSLVPNPTISNLLYTFINPLPTVVTTLTLTVANAVAAPGYPSCVIITEAAASAPTDQISAATQYAAAVTAILAGTTPSGSYGNACATSSSMYCRCPSVFNSTLISGVGNWDIFYPNNQVIIWTNYDDSPPNGSAFTVLNVPPAP